MTAAHPSLATAHPRARFARGSLRAQLHHPPGHDQKRHPRGIMCGATIWMGSRIAACSVAPDRLLIASSILLLCDGAKEAGPSATASRSVLDRALAKPTDRG